MGLAPIILGFTSIHWSTLNPTLVNSSYEKRWTRFRYVWANLERFNSELESEWSVPGSGGETLKIIREIKK